MTFRRIPEKDAVYGRHKLHPERYSRRTYLFASGTLVTFMFLASQLIFSPTRSATLPSETISVSGPEYSKFEPAGSPPLHAKIHSL